MPITLDGTSGITTPGLTNTGTETVVNLTTTGNTTLGDATTDTLTVGVTGIVKDASGNVGIGTASPSMPASNRVVIDVNGTTSSLIAQSSGGTTRGYGYVDSTQMIYGSKTAIPLIFQTTETERMRIDSSGNVGIGTSSPPVTLSVAGTIGVFGGSLNGSLGSPQLYRPASDTLAIATGAVERMRIDASGNLGVGVTPSAWGTANSERALQLTGGSLWSYSSFGLGLLNNAFYDSTGAYKYRNNGFATHYFISSNNGAHAWFTAPSGTAGNAITFTQSLAVERAKSLALEGATSQTGTGITFPATQSASSDANTLDDYEEGTWTPVLTGTTAVSYANQVGRYTKIGRLVTIQFILQTNSQTYTSTGATFAISGLPFTGTFPGYTGGDGAANLYNITFTGYVLCSVNSSSLNLTQIQSAAAFSSLTNAAAPSGFIISGIISYITT